MRRLLEEETLDRQEELLRPGERVVGAKTGGTDGASRVGTPAERRLHRGGLNQSARETPNSAPGAPTHPDPLGSRQASPVPRGGVNRSYADSTAIQGRL